MKVIKFGGTSVGSTKGLKKVRQIVESINEPVIVVVSAFSGITDKLIKTSNLASIGDEAYQQVYEEIVATHKSIIEELFEPNSSREALIQKVTQLLNELNDIFQGIFLIKDLSPKTLDTVLSYGERISSKVVTYLIDGAKRYDSRSFIKTEKKHAKNFIDKDLTTQLIQETFNPIPEIAVVPGFISSDKLTGDVSNLGRGGSDYTAAMIAAALDASCLEIWTDVDGFMTADPNVINSAYTINELSYVEATELCNFGAKVR